MRIRARSCSTALDPAAARGEAIKWLARRDYARRELCAKLEERGFDAAVIAAVAAELQAEGALNDQRYAEHFVAYHAQRGHGPTRIRAELRAVGIEAGLIEDALAAEDWPRRARAVRVRKFGAAPVQNFRESARQARFLQYRGFSSDHIRIAIGNKFDLDESP